VKEEKLHHPVAPSMVGCSAARSVSGTPRAPKFNVEAALCTSFGWPNPFLTPPPSERKKNCTTSTLVVLEQVPNSTLNLGGRGGQCYKSSRQLSMWLIRCHRLSGATFVLPTDNIIQKFDMPVRRPARGQAHTVEQDMSRHAPHGLREFGPLAGNNSEALRRRTVQATQWSAAMSRHSPRGIRSRLKNCCPCRVGLHWQHLGWHSRAAVALAEPCRRYSSTAE
jgi:hypothetical protein